MNTSRLLLAVWEADVECDDCPAEHLIITDGHRLHMHPGDDTLAAEREGAQITVRCTAPHRWRETCGGSVVVDLSAPQWVEATEQHATLLDTAAVDITRVD